MKTFKQHLDERCWPGHKPVPGKKPYSPGSCTKEETNIVESGGEVLYKKGDYHIEKYGEDSFALYMKGKKQKFYPSLNAAKNDIKESVEQIEEGRPSQRHPLEGHEYHKKTDAQLKYIAKDAHEAAEKMKGHNEKAENKYRDQVNDASSVLHFRKNGMPDWYKKKYGHMNEEVVLEMDNRTPWSDRREQRANSPEEKAKREKQFQDNLRKAGPNVRKKLGLPEPSKSVSEEVEQIEEGTPAWQRKEGKNPEGGLNQKGVESYRRENPGSKLQTAVTTEPSKLKPGSKAAKRRLSFCRRMKGMKEKLTSAKTARDPDSRINKSLRKWNC